MPDVIISDTSCLILLEKIGNLDLLNRIYSTLYVTPHVREEYGKLLPDWIILKKPKNEALQKTLEQTLDLGEASSIALAFENDNVTLIMDDLKARKAAKHLNFKVTGTLGVILKAKELGFIREVKPLIQNLLLTDFRISQNVVEEILKRAGE